MTPSETNSPEQVAAAKAEAEAKAKAEAEAKAKAEAEAKAKAAAAAAAKQSAQPQKGDSILVRYLDQGPATRVAHAKVIKAHRGDGQALDLEVYRPGFDPMHMEMVARAKSATAMGWFYE